MVGDYRPRVSVAIGTRNGATFVAEQLRSIIDQSYPPAEIVLSDDASTDDTVAIASAVVGASGVALRVIRNPTPLGVTANFQQALEACNGELVALADQDDRWHSDRLARVVPLFAERPRLLLVHCDATLVDAVGAPLGASLFDAIELGGGDRRRIHGGAALDLLLRRNVVTGATVVVRSSLIEQARPFPQAWVHDEWLAMMAAVFGEIDLIDEHLVDYRQHGGNQIGARRLGLRDKVGRIQEPRTVRNARLEARAVALAERLHESAASVAVQLLADEKLAHERVRNALPARRRARVAPVLRQLLLGRYARFGRGILDAARDLLQPA